MFKEILTSIVLSSSLCNAQSPTQPAETLINKISVTESFSIVKYKGDGDTLVQFLQGVDFKLTDNLVVGLDLPVYFADTTNLGSIGLDLTYGAWENGVASLDLIVGIATPMETVYGATSISPNVGGVFTYNLPWANMKFEQTFNYEFVIGDAFSLPFGSKVSDDIITADSTILCPIADSFKIGATVWQNYTVVTDGQQNILAGPEATWNVAQNVNLSGSFAVPVYQNVSVVAEQDFIISANLGIKF